MQSQRRRMIGARETASEPQDLVRLVLVPRADAAVAGREI